MATERHIGVNSPGPGGPGRARAASPLGDYSDSGLGQSVPPGAEIVNRAASVLAREVAALPGIFRTTGPVERVPVPAPSVVGEPFSELQPALEDLEPLRRRVHDLVETLLTALGPKVASTDERVPLISCLAPADAGSEGTAVIRIANAETHSSEATLYCSNFISDSGHEIPPSRVAFSPRTVKIPPKGEATIQMKIAVPLQAAAGMYSALVQAAGTRYVKTVVSLQVK